MPSTAERFKDEILRHHIAFSSVGPTTLRKMVGKGKRKRICNCLTEIDLSVLQHRKLAAVIDGWTQELRQKVHIKWGPARKAINLYLRDISYNFMARRKYRAEKFEKQLEIPLDNKIMSKIRSKTGSRRLRRSSVKGLTCCLSNDYQQEAQKIADKKKMLRVDLDALWWSR
jgi:hypothetical protein